MASIDVLDPNVLLELLQQGKLWGVSMQKFHADDEIPNKFANLLPQGSTDDNQIGSIINLGEIVYEDTETEEDDEFVPYGYEEESIFTERQTEMTLKRYVYQKVVISLTASGFLDEGTTVLCKSFDLIPANHSTSRPKITFEHNDSNMKTLDVLVGEKVSFYLKIQLPNKFEGSLNRLLVMDLSATEEINRFASKQSNFKIGILILGSVVHRAVHHASSLSNSFCADDSTANGSWKAILSTEASPFIPKSLMLNFNNPVSYLCRSTFLSLKRFLTPFNILVHNLLRRYYDVSTPCSPYTIHASNLQTSKLQFS